MQFTELLTLALRAVSDKAILLLAMVMAFGLFAWAMDRGTVIALWTAAVFAVLLFWPIAFRGTHGTAPTSGSDDD